MKIKTGLLFNLRKAEYAEGAALALSNAKEFLIIAEFCQIKALYAKGTTNLVFALEELAKAAILQLKALNPQIRVTNLYDYFHKHNTKHVTILQLVNVLEANTAVSSASEDDAPQKGLEGISLIAIIALLFIGYLLIKKVNIDSEAVHESQPKDDRTFHELLRQTGLYVEFNERTRSWTKPEDVIDESLFTMLLNQVNNSISVIETRLFGEGCSASSVIDIADALDDECIMTKLAKKQLIHF